MLNLLITVEFEGINKEVIFITCESIYELILVLMCCAMSGVVMLITPEFWLLTTTISLTCIQTLLSSTEHGVSDFICAVRVVLLALLIGHGLEKNMLQADTNV